MRRNLGGTYVCLLLALVIGMAACVPPTTSSRLARSSRVVTLEEISISDASNLHELLRRQRPSMLLARAPRSGGNLTEVTPVVYVNGVRAGDTDVLLLIPASTVIRVELLTETEASSRLFLQHHTGPVISVMTRSPWRR